MILNVIRPDRAVRLGVVALTVAGVLALPACFTPRDTPREVPPPEPRTAPPPPLGKGRVASCMDLRNDANFSTLIIAKAISAEPSSGQAYRDGVAEAYESIAARLLTAALDTGDGELSVAVLRWSRANTEIGEYVRVTEPSGDNVLELGPANDLRIAAEAEVKALCGDDF